VTDDEIKRFLNQVDSAYDEYDQGYADADATLRRVKRHVETLREAVDDR
jgi:hypothetical protein